MLLVIDIGGSFIKYGLMKKHELGEVRKVATPKTMVLFKETLQTIYFEVKDSVVGISVSMPGMIDSETGYAVHGGALDYIKNFNILEFYQEIFNCPVAVENDAKCALLGEMHLGHLKGVKNAVMVVIGTGIGGGILLNGQLVRGTRQAAGELSLIQTTHSMQATDLFALKNNVYSLLKPFANEKKKKLDEVDGKIFFDAVERGDETAKNILLDYCDSLAVQLLNLQSLLDPEKIIISGGISNR